MQGLRAGSGVEAAGGSDNSSVLLRPFGHLHTLPKTAFTDNRRCQYFEASLA